MILIISSDGSVSIGEATTGPADKSTDVTDKGNETYDVKFVDQDPNPGTYILTLKFNDVENNKNNKYFKGFKLIVQNL